jgi:hypothetical protein
MKPLSLTDRQLTLVRNAARAMPVNARDQFLRDVASHLADTPSDAAVMMAINVTYDRVPVLFATQKRRR